MKKTILITSKLANDSTAAAQLAEMGFDLIMQPLIETESVTFEKTIPVTNWIFFSSKNGVTHFFGQKPKIGKQKFAAIGRGTAQVLSEFAKSDFVGDSSDTEKIAQQFKSVARTSKVLFPQAEDSMRSIQKALKPERCVEITCYRTKRIPQSVGFPDILVFTSPSNVQAYAASNKIMDHQVVIAYGKSTANALHEIGRDKVDVMKNVSEKSLVETIKRATAS